MSSIQLTQDGYNQLVAELKQLEEVQKPQTVERLQRARALGDLSENSEYTASKEDLDMYEGRIMELKHILKNAQVVTDSTDDGHVDIGCIVIVETNGKTMEFMIVGDFEADPMQKKLSHTSPIGKALIGKKKGHEVHVQVPAGKTKYKIVDIKKRK